MARIFEWNKAKAASNIKKHRVTFNTASRVFLDKDHLSELESHVGNEERWQTTGQVDVALYVVVIHTDWEDNGDEIIRIISARRATPRERKKYEQGKFGSLRH